MSMQCAVNALIQSGFDVPPYKGVIEPACEKTVKQYVDSLYPELKTYLECEKTDEKDITCFFEVIKSGHFENLIMVESIGEDLFQNKKLDPEWLESFTKVSSRLKDMMFIVFAKCTPKSLISLRAILKKSQTY